MSFVIGAGLGHWRDLYSTVYRLADRDDRYNEIMKHETKQIQLQE
jgi:hypothetical protein